MPNLVSLHEKFCTEREIFDRQSPKTIAWHQDAFQSLRRFRDVKKVQDVTPQLMSQWVIHGHQLGWAAKTLANRMTSLRIFFKWLISKDHCTENPLADLRRPKLPKKIPKHLTKDEADHLLRITRNYPYYYPFERPRAIAIMSLFLATGLRKEELRTLEWADINLDNRTLLVRSGKGNKDRLICLPPSCIPVLEDYCQARQRLKRTTPYFWASLTRDDIMCENSLQTLILKLRKASGLKFSAHTLRHTFAVMLLENEADIYAISKILGHSDIRTTTIYLWATTNLLKTQIQKHPMAF